MKLDNVVPGENVPYEYNVIIEIPAEGGPVKYELEKETGAMFVDRFMAASMRYPCNYGYVPMTLAEDDDPVDVLVITPAPLLTGSVVTCRSLGILKMTDEKGPDSKILAVPIPKLCQDYDNIHSYKDLAKIQLDGISHFFEHYKELE